MSKGADFSDIYPRGATGSIDAKTPAALSTDGSGLDTGIVQPVTPSNSYRMGQQIMFWLTVFNPLTTGVAPNWISRIRLKPWWARPNMEMRQAFGGSGAPGSNAVLGVDPQVFGDSASGSNLVDNRMVWVPSQKRLDVTEFQTPPPVAAPARHSDSVFLEDLWTIDLQDPNDAAYAGKFGSDQVVGRTIVFPYPAMGYALGFTYEVTGGVDPGDALTVGYNLSWVVGTFGGGGSYGEGA